MRTYMVEVEEVADVLYKVEADSPDEANYFASRGLGTLVGRWTTSREVVCGEELDD